MSARSLAQVFTMTFDISDMSGERSFAPNVWGRTWISISRRVPAPSGTQRTSEVNSVPTAKPRSEKLRGGDHAAISMSTEWRPRHSRNCVPTPTGPGVNISTFVIALMRPEAFAKSDARSHMRSGGADDVNVQSIGFIGRPPLQVPDSQRWSDTAAGC